MILSLSINLCYFVKTLLQLYSFSGQISPMRTITASPLRTTGTVEINNDVIQFYKDTGLENVAKEVQFNLQIQQSFAVLT